MFCSHARAHGFFTREPWDFGEEVKVIYKKYAELRYQMMPYIYSEAVKAVNTGLPMHKALVMEYAGDPTVAGIDWEYLFGDSILVAPVMNEDDRATIYLPEGLWTDYWTKRQIAGRQWMTYDATLDILPLFIRENAIIPMGPVMQYVNEKPLDTITLDLYPIIGTNLFTIYDAGEAITIRMTADDGVTVEISESDRNFRLLVNNFAFATLEVNGKATVIEGKNILTLDSDGKRAYSIRMK